MHAPPQLRGWVETGAERVTPESSDPLTLDIFTAASGPKAAMGDEALDTLSGIWLEGLKECDCGGEDALTALPEMAPAGLRGRESKGGGMVDELLGMLLAGLKGKESRARKVEVLEGLAVSWVEGSSARDASPKVLFASLMGMVVGIGSTGIGGGGASLDSMLEVLSSAGGGGLLGPRSGDGIVSP